MGYDPWHTQTLIDSIQIQKESHSVNLRYFELVFVHVELSTVKIINVNNSNNKK